MSTMINDSQFLHWISDRLSSRGDSRNADFMHRLRLIADDISRRDREVEELRTEILHLKKGTKDAV